MEHIFVSGITPIEAYPEQVLIKYSKQCLEKVDLCIPTLKPDIEEINEIYVDACLEKVKIIDSILGQKLVVEGIFSVKVIYTADNMVQSVHSAHFEKRFYNYVLLGDLDSCDYSGVIRDVFIGIEDIGVTHICSRRINLSVIFVICPQISKEREIPERTRKSRFKINDLCHDERYSDGILNSSVRKILDYSDTNNCNCKVQKNKR